MSEAEAIAHIKAADADGNMAIDFAEFGKLWEALHGAEEVWEINSCQLTFAKFHSARRKAPSRALRNFAKVLNNTTRLKVI